MITKAPKGTKDLLPSDSYKWQYIESIFRETCINFGYSEIRTPTFEHTELFERGVGDTTDVVEKQMYTFNDKSNRSITLRPEGTASVVRCFLENNLYANSLPAKMFYNISCFRYEKPQAGRLREFHQFGVEAFGSGEPSLDAEIISLAITFLNRLGLKNLELNINSIGCPECRKRYNEALREYFYNNYTQLCETCKGRLERNPLRILDCKSPICQDIAKNAPILLDYICDDCRTHFDSVQTILNDIGIKYGIDAKIVRGLDYYCKTVFEILSNNIGAKSAVCGGGRYDGLVEELGGTPTPAIGFGLGIERLILALDSQEITIPNENKLDVFIASVGENASKHVQKLAYLLRNQGISVDFDHMKKSLKAQMKYADKIGALYSVVIGDDEAEKKQAEIKNMKTGEKTAVNFSDMADFFKK
ncbi:MAG: histidine--tRNA ligase [Clostridia bacterium]|nr:histidine--tRNA ligase [Clostridia bacterium]